MLGYDFDSHNGSYSPLDQDFVFSLEAVSYSAKLGESRFSRYESESQPLGVDGVKTVK
jgi:hypothetical protein